MILIYKNLKFDSFFQFKYFFIFLLYNKIKFMYLLLQFAYLIWFLQTWCTLFYIQFGISWHNLLMFFYKFLMCFFNLSQVRSHDISFRYLLTLNTLLFLLKCLLLVLSKIVLLAPLISVWLRLRNSNFDYIKAINFLILLLCQDDWVRILCHLLFASIPPVICHRKILFFLNLSQFLRW